LTAKAALEMVGQGLRGPFKAELYYKGVRDPPPLPGSVSQTDELLDNAPQSEPELCYALQAIRRRFKARLKESQAFNYTPRDEVETSDWRLKKLKNCLAVTEGGCEKQQLTENVVP
jgi:hypothetical protein